jgi:hypothetical protein
MPEEVRSPDASGPSKPRPINPSLSHDVKHCLQRAVQYEHSGGEQSWSRITRGLAGRSTSLRGKPHDVALPLMSIPDIPEPIFDMYVLALTKYGEIDADNGRRTRKHRLSVSAHVVSMFAKTLSLERTRRERLWGGSASPIRKIRSRDRPTARSPISP